MAVYHCNKCGKQAHKDPVQKGLTHGLGHWHCDRCGKTKVNRSNSGK